MAFDFTRTVTPFNMPTNILGVRNDPSAQMGLAGFASGFGGALGGASGLTEALIGGFGGAAQGMAQGQEIEREQANIEAEQERLRQQAEARQAIAQQELGLRQQQFGLRKSEFDDAQRTRMAGREFAGTLQPQNQQQAIAIRNAQLTGDLSGLSSVFGQAAGKPQIFGNAQLGFHALQDGEVRQLVAPTAGGVDREKQFSMEQGLRKETSALPSVKNYREVVPAIKSAFETAGQDTKAADLNIVFATMKAVDPASVVRESEQQVAMDAGSPAQRWMGLWNSLQGGGRLTPQQRQELLGIVESRGRAFFDSAQEDLGGFREIATASELDPSLAVARIEDFPSRQQAAAQSMTPTDLGSMSMEQLQQLESSLSAGNP